MRDERRSPRDVLLATLRRELRALGWRARRRALQEVDDHVLSAIDDEIAAGAAPGEAEQLVIDRFGDPRVIAAQLASVRPRRLRRVVPALAGAAVISGVLALAAGPIADGLSPHRAVAAAAVGPSERGCATAFDSTANARTRGLVSAVAGANVQISATPAPACVIRFQLSSRRVMTFEAPWLHGTAVGFSVSIQRPAQVVTGNATWQGRVLRATGLAADQPLLLGPAPTITSCLDAWNASPPALRSSHPKRVPAVIQAFNGGVSIAGTSGISEPELTGFACTVWIETPAGHTTLVAGAYVPRGATRWRAPITASGLLASAIPNADLGADGRLTLRVAAPAKPAAANQPPPPKIAHVIGASGWAGGFKLYGTLAQAIRRYGPPTERIPSGFGCQVSWPALHLAGTFSFGRTGSGASRRSTPCGATGIAMSLTATDGWSTTRGLTVGASESEIRTRYPGSTSLISPSTGTTSWYLVPRHGSASGRGLTAQTRLGAVISITVAVGSTTFGADIVSPKTP